MSDFSKLANQDIFKTLSPRGKLLLLVSIVVASEPSGDSQRVSAVHAVNFVAGGCL